MAVTVSEILGQSTDDNVLRPVLTASRPSQTMATMGPLNMSESISIGSVRHRKARVVERLTGNETGEERLLGEIGIVLLEELTRRRDQLQSGELEAMESNQYGPGKRCIMITYPRDSKREMMGPTRPRCVCVSQSAHNDIGPIARILVGEGRSTWTPSGLMAMKLDERLAPAPSKQINSFRRGNRVLWAVKHEMNANAQEWRGQCNSRLFGRHFGYVRYQKRTLKNMTIVRTESKEEKTEERVSRAWEKIIMADNRRSGGAGGVPCWPTSRLVLSTWSTSWLSLFMFCT